ncbi:phage baseplate protein [Herbaspirillum chlorophenolicum]|uniref:Phage baseplate protein n=1 Tax=Herbaspirillum chlorophenolicum TaxID=211589 RepID=A0ABW8F5F3_9BURK
MANPALDVPEYPDVPDVDGVPPLLRDPDAGLPPDEEEITEDQVQPTIAPPPVWGIFDQDGNEVLFPDSVLGIRYRDGSRIVDYPLEQGSFESYNKVATPFDVAMSVSIGGSVERREGFLRDLAFLKQSLDLFNVITPEFTFQNVNIEAYDYERRARNGVSLIVVEIYMREVRTGAVAAFSPAKSDSAQDDQKQGQVQAKDPTPLALNTYTSQGVA